MAALPWEIDLFFHLPLGGGRLVVSRCAECGLVVAASPYESMLVLAERMHTCPVYLNYSRNA